MSKKREFPLKSEHTPRDEKEAKMKRYVIVGNGVAGTTAAENIRKMDPEGMISLLTDEAIPFYYRIRLNEYLSGDITEEKLVAKQASWFKKQKMNLHLDTKAVDIMGEEKIVLTARGKKIPYDSLLIATGSHAFLPPIKGSDKDGLFSLRTFQDAQDIVSWAKGIEKVVIIGGGLLGLEAGNGLRKLGKKIIVVEFFPRLLPRQLDIEGARRLQVIMEKMGFSFRLGVKTQEIQGDGSIKGVQLEDGETLSAEMVIVSAGVRPNMALADSAGLNQDKGIQVDDQLRTSQSNIYAAGDVAEFQGLPYGIWPAAMEQGKIAGINMAGGHALYKGTTMANTLKVVGIDLASAGEVDAEDAFESKIQSGDDHYRKVVIKDNQIIGCIMLGDTKGFNRITKMMAEKTDISQLGEDLYST
jgi:nitrite reductase (NADH) large subunit